MHAAMMASDPPLIYLLPGSWQVIDVARRLQSEGVPLLFTADAGPNVKIFCLPEAAAQVKRAIGGLECVQRLIHARPGLGAEVLEP
jgi:diphosphomevalonate decarboxylase